jgi:hypothetical protein
LMSFRVTMTGHTIFLITPEEWKVNESCQENTSTTTTIEKASHPIVTYQVYIAPVVVITAV